VSRALVTGATGFIGSRLAASLSRRGWEVHALARPSSDLSPLDRAGGEVEVHRHDGTVPGMSRVLERTRPDVVFHLASLFLARHRPEDVEPLVESNIAFPARLLEAMSASGVDRLVNAGTSWQHHLDRAYEPVNLYAATKQGFLDILAFYRATTALRTVHLSLFDTYGPGDPRPKLVPLLVRTAREGTPLAMSPGGQLIDLVFVDDAVSAFVMAGERLLEGKARRFEEWAVASGRPLSLRGLVALFEKVAGAPLPVEWGALPYRPREVMVPWRKGKPLPGWKPEVDLEEGLRRTIEGAR